jgi:hypothetical protein
VDELVAEHMVGLPVASRERHDDALFDALCHATGALSQLPAHGIGLLKIGAVSVEDQRLFLLKLSEEGPGVAIVPPLRHPGRILNGLLLLRVEVNLKLVRLEGAEVKLFVLDLILPKVLGRRRSYGPNRRGDRKRKESESKTHKRSLHSGQGHQ